MTPDERDEIKRLHAELVDVLLDDENDEVCTERYEAFTTRLDSLTDEGTEARLAAVRALPARWRARANRCLRDASALDVCVYELLAALDGETS